MPHEIYQRGKSKIWHYRGTVSGRRLRGTCGTADKAIAQRVAAEAEAKEWKRHLDGPGAQVTFAQATIAYLDAEKPSRFIAKIAAHWKDTAIREISSGGIRQSAITLYPKAKGATRNRQVIVPTQAIINHAATLEWCSPIKVKRFDVEAKSKGWATADWVQAFATHASPHLGALCFFMFGTGARIGEAVRMTWGDVDMSTRFAVLSGRKPKPWTRRAHLPAPVWAAMANIGGNRKPDELVFGYLDPGNVKQVWDNAIARAGIARLTPHSCRHGFATTMLRAGIDPKTVAAMGGWKDVATVMKYYAHAVTDPTVTDAVFGTNITQSQNAQSVTIGNTRKKMA
ncbi:MAG: site-specific integrase [Cypionkella sp.]|uniref:tyrosine-type recombinase/integrase n=1 Tax=Cypionkella sp. TaxID=2811411 RepID=UPI0027311F21|nr:site-specific integrase [Cypionkella sp.]MDP2051119.1 site-specific integrase [Cypionkella sp.]